jgi:hypothetical protein
MYAFGDSLFFLGVFGLAALPASGAALFFLRPLRWLWRILSIGALTVAATGLGALASYLAPQNVDMGPFLTAWSSLSPLRALLAPLWAMAFCLAGLFAPTRTARFALLGAAGIEAIVFVWVMLIWFNPFR